MKRFTLSFDLAISVLFVFFATLMLFIANTQIIAQQFPIQESLIHKNTAFERLETKKFNTFAQEFHNRTISRNKGDSISKVTAIKERFFTGTAAGDFFGRSVANAGDVNGDGYSDIIVGASSNDAGGTNAGRAYIYFGGPNMDVIADVILTGETAYDQFGYSVASTGDVNGDGYGDLIVGAAGNAGERNAGCAYIFYGNINMDNVADIILIGEAAHDLFGCSVALAGDVNGDGYSDVVVGASGNGTNGRNAGRAYIFYGSANMDAIADVIFSGDRVEDFLGKSVASAGDVNRDGFSDVIVGASGSDAGGTDAGQAYIYFGNTNMDDIADITLTGEATSDHFGNSVASAGDINGDGHNDIIAGAYHNDANGTDAGRTYIYFGDPNMDSVPDVVLSGENMYDYFGGSVAYIGDVNGDDYSDIIVGSRTGGTLGGGAYIYYGNANMDNIPDIILSGKAANDEFGFSVASAGDVNGDGYNDFIVGAPGNDNAGENAGRAYLYLNSLTGTDIADVIFTGESAYDYFGSSVMSAGDVNGDGYSDIIIGAYGNDTNGYCAGRVYLYYGAGAMTDNSVDVIFTGIDEWDFFGYSVAGAGDINGDGYSDVIVGAYGDRSSGTNIGRAYVYFGGPIMDNVADVNLSGANGWSEFGSSVASAGDINGDGYSDILVGTPHRVSGNRVGYACIYFGGISMDNIIDLTFTDDDLYEEFGNCVASAGDVNGDGYSDIIIGAYLHNAGGEDAGRAYIYFGGTSMDNVVDVILTGEAEDDHFGYSVATAGDVNGDGYSDVIVGGYLNDAGALNAGRAYIYFGSVIMDDVADVIITGGASYDCFGGSVASAGDVNRDGFSDVIVGATYHYRGGVNNGKGYIYFGGTNMDNIVDITLNKNATHNCGLSFASAGDVNCDGYGDIIEGAIYGDVNNAGMAYLYISSSPPIVPRITSVDDVSNDQGGKVTIRWVRSSYDVLGIAKITDYIIQRSLPPGVSGFAWENIATFKAMQDPVYSFTAETLYDSSMYTDGTFFYRVIARTSNPLELWKSAPMAGYSVDNLAPSTVKFLSAKRITDSSVKLKWDKNVIDPDVQHYAIYRSHFEGFVPTARFQIGTTTNTTFVDNSPIMDKTNYYCVITFDIHGNSSPPSQKVSVMINTIPNDYALYQNYPNPFNPSTIIKYFLKEDRDVVLKIYNIVGQEVCTLVKEKQSAGYKIVEWDGKSNKGQSVPGGIYIYRITTSDYNKSRKMILIK